MTRLSQLSSPPEIGRKYLVPCCRAYKADGCGKSAIIPVMGGMHSDPELGGAGLFPHWHIDWRFITFSIAVSWFRIDLKKDWDAGQAFAYALFDQHTKARGDNAPIYIGERPRVCRRDMPRFSVFESPTRTRLQKMCISRVLDTNTMVCPHKGIPLSNIPIDADGCITCPGHGLRWHSVTGELVPFSIADPAITPVD